MSNSNDMISLFAEQRTVRSGVSPVFLSSGLHVVGLGLLSYGFLHLPRIQEPIVTEREFVRHLDLRSPDLPTKPIRDNRNLYPRADTSEVGKSAPPAAKPIPSLPEFSHAGDGKQILVQPRVPARVALTEAIPVPTVVIWTPELALTKQIVGPLPEKPLKVESKASLDPPNQELNRAEVAATAAAEAQPKVQLPAPATTSPLVTHADAVAPTAPATVSNSTTQPTPAAVLSISDVRMTEGTVVLPAVNETLGSEQKSGSPAPAGTPAAHAGTHLPAPADGSGEHGQADRPTASAKGGDGGTTEHIQLPKDGKFGVVVVGTSLAEEFPETLAIWSNRVAYTAYLHVGLTRNWILQYAQLRSVEASVNGTVARVEAPWPYDILRPNLVSSDLNADALMVHGILNESGQLESLKIAFPAQFSHAAFVISALQQWHFRPARQQGKPTSVEVLLIIPDELD